jgi:hypothetical protein
VGVPRELAVLFGVVHEGAKRAFELSHDGYVIAEIVDKTEESLELLLSPWEGEV